MDFEMLRKRKEALGISYDELAEASKIPKGTLTNILLGRTPNPRIDTIQAIERALGLSPDKAIVETTAKEQELLLSFRELGELKGGEDLQDFFLNTLQAMVKNGAHK